MEQPALSERPRIEAVVVPRTTDLGDGFTVRRALPSAQRRMVGPFVFFDQMGPALLRAGAGKPEHNAERLRHVGEQLDQCWDLLRQRRAKREFGEDPNTAEVRDVGTVERYQG